MFVLNSTYQQMFQRAIRAELVLRSVSDDRDRLTDKWNALVNRINALGGENFLQRGAAARDDRFSAEDIQRLLQLCHPDKHDGKQMATDMTAKLLKMKG